MGVGVGVTVGVPEGVGVGVGVVPVTAVPMVSPAAAALAMAELREDTHALPTRVAPETVFLTLILALCPFSAAVVKAGIAKAA